MYHSDFCFLSRKYTIKEDQADSNILFPCYNESNIKYVVIHVEPIVNDIIDIDYL